MPDNFASGKHFFTCIWLFESKVLNITNCRQLIKEFITIFVYDVFHLSDKTFTLKIISHGKINISIRFFLQEEENCHQEFEFH